MRLIALIPGKEIGQGFIFAHRQIEQLRKQGVEVSIFFLATRTSLIGIIKEAYRFHSLARDFAPDVVHVHYGTVTALFGVILSTCPVVITFRGSDLNPSSEFSKTRGFLSRLFSQVAAVFAKEIICVSEELRQRLWVKRARAEVVPSGVDVDEFYPIERDKARDMLGWNRAERIVLFNQGPANAPNKRRDFAEKAVEIVRQDMPSTRLVVMEGDVSGGQVPLYINAADVVLLVSDYEGSPNIVKEALACNAPVCSVNAGDVEHMLEGVSNSVVVGRTPEAIAAGLLQLLCVPCRSNGRKMMFRYSAKATLERVLAVLTRASDAYK